MRLVSKLCVLAFALASLCACAATGEWYEARIDGLADHSPERGVVLFDIDIVSTDEDAREDKHPLAKWQNLTLDEDVDDERAFLGRGYYGEMLAYSVKPGIHRLFVSFYKGVSFWDPRPNRVLVFAVQPGEVVYVGKLLYTWDIPPGKYSIKIKDDFHEADEYLAEKFPSLRGKLQKRLARYTRIESLEQPYGGRTAANDAALTSALNGLQMYWSLQK